MKRVFLMMTAFAAVVCSAQVVEDFKPASTNQEGQEYPMVNSQRMVRARISAPDAKSVKLDIGIFVHTTFSACQHRVEVWISSCRTGRYGSGNDHAREQHKREQHTDKLAWFVHHIILRLLRVSVQRFHARFGIGYYAITRYNILVYHT